MKATITTKDKILKTKWADSVNRELPLCKYPRPGLKRRDWQCLNGLWEYAFADTDDEPPEKSDGNILVPFSPETLLSGVGKALLPSEKLYYKRTFDVNTSKKDKRVLLHFEAVDWKCKVLLNGLECGRHTGGYLPFSFDVTEYIRQKNNVLEVIVTDPTDTMWQQRGKQKLDPTKIWYTPTSGIWQTVWLETVPQEFIESISIIPKPEENKVELNVVSNSDSQVKARVYAKDKLVTQLDFTAGQVVDISIPSPHLWTPDDPFLYQLKLELESDTGIDKVDSYFGMRTVSLKKGAAGRDIVLLNGQAVFINGPLDQGYWPESGMTPPTDEAMIFDLEQTKALGFNTTRKHVKIESRRWYYHADRLGLLVIQDMPSGGKKMANGFQTKMAVLFNRSVPDNNEKAYKLAQRSDPVSRCDFESELFDMIEHLGNHPCIIIWCPFNEAWGQFDSKRIYELIKKIDKTRLVDHASGWYDQNTGDFRSIHTYKIKLKNPPQRDKRAYLISEYGGYNYIEKDHLWESQDNFGYKFFKSKSDLMDAYEKLINKQVLPLVEKGLCGVIYTQLSDVEIETNGIFTYDRAVMKFDAVRTRSIHKQIYERFKEFNS